MSATTAAEAQELLTLLQEIEARVTALEAKRASSREMLLTFNAVLAASRDVANILRRMGLPEEATQLINTLLRMVTMVNQLQISISLLYATSGPIGWVLGGLGIASTAITFTDMMGSH